MYFFFGGLSQPGSKRQARETSYYNFKRDGHFTKVRRLKINKFSVALPVMTTDTTGLEGVSIAPVKSLVKYKKILPH